MPRTITVSGGNLLDIAAREMGDARAAWRIAAANGLLDWWLTGQTTLAIPDPDPAQVNDGLPIIGVGLALPPGGLPAFPSPPPAGRTDFAADFSGDFS